MVIPSIIAILKLTYAPPTKIFFMKMVWCELLTLEHCKDYGRLQKYPWIYSLYQTTSFNSTKFALLPKPEGLYKVHGGHINFQLKNKLPPISCAKALRCDKDIGRNDYKVQFFKIKKACTKQHIHKDLNISILPNP